MTIDKEIYRTIQELPTSLQGEVLDFIQYLLAKAEREESEVWANFSLSQALRGTEEDTVPTYELSDLKVIFE